MKTKTFFLLIILLISSSLEAFEYHTYSFEKLSTKLGYPSENFFGSTEKEVFDLSSYTEKGETYYQEINNYLRYFPAPYEWYGTSPEDAKVMVESMDHIFKNVPVLPEDLILFRGLTLNFRKNKSFNVGEEFSDKGFVSTSTTFSVAIHFAVEMNKDEPEKKRAIFVMYQNAPEQKGILIDQEEDEVILKRSQLFKIMDKRNEPGKSYETYLVQVCKQTCDGAMNPDIIKFWQAHHY
jgi:hypothetical protein